MNRLLFLLTGVGSLILLSGCQKQPEASFETDKTEYVAGETVRLTNTTLEGDSYFWILPNGESSSATNVNYPISVDHGDGSLTFKLEAYSKNGKKDDEAEKTVTVKAATGDAIFWQEAGTGFGNTVVSINGLSSNITADYTSVPPCSSSGCAVFNDLEIGTYSFSASDGTYNWNGTITITKDGCKTVLLN